MLKIRIYYDNYFKNNPCDGKNLIIGLKNSKISTFL